MPPIEQRLTELGLEIPTPLSVRGQFNQVTVRGDTAYVSGVIATYSGPPRIAYPGRIGEDLTLDEGRESARLALLAILSNLKAQLVSLDFVEQFLHIGGYVNVAPDFTKVHHVVGAANELIGELFGSDSLASRTAVGVAQLPENASVMLDAVVAVSDSRL